MKKVRILSIISCVLCLIMLSTSSVYAQGSTNLKSIERFEVKTDLQDLLDLAVEQAKSPNNSSNSFSRSTYSNAPQKTNTLTAEQITEKITYKNGAEEYKCVSTGLLLDEEITITPQSNGISTLSSSGIINDSGSINESAVSAISKVFYIYSYENTYHYFTITYTESKVTKKNTSVGIDLFYTITKDLGDDIHYTWYITPEAALNRVYTWVINSGKIKVHPYWGGACGGAIFMTSSREYDLAINCRRYLNDSPLHY